MRRALSLYALLTLYSISIALYTIMDTLRCANVDPMYTVCVASSLVHECEKLSTICGRMKLPRACPLFSYNRRRNALSEVGKLYGKLSKVINFNIVLSPLSETHLYN